jgi:predicted amidophosphoribosyltransferase
VNALFDKAETAARAVCTWVFPSDIYCCACGNLTDATRPYALCDRCVREIEWIAGRTCDRCGRPLAKTRVGTICGYCRTQPHVFDAGVSCAVYAGRARDMVRALKYSDAAWIADKIAEIMYDRYTSLFCGDSQHARVDADGVLHDEGFRDGDGDEAPVVVWAPMSETKKRKRGYDQAELIARCFARKSGFPLGDGRLERVWQTTVMRSLGAEGRRANMSDAFAISHYTRRLIRDGDIILKDVLLIDDVVTTGSTADACASSLKEIGARHVRLFTFATGTDA